MNYRDLKPDELVEQGDEFFNGIKWRPSELWIDRWQNNYYRYRRPIKDIDVQLSELAKQMRAVAMLMLTDDQSATMKSHGVDLQVEAAIVSDWVERIQSEKTIQKFIDSKKEVTK